MKIFSYFIVLIIIIFGITFAVLNANPVTFHYYVGVKMMPLSLLMVLCFLLGVALTFLIMTFSLLRLKAQARSLRKQLKSAQKEIENLRIAPVKG